MKKAESMAGSMVKVRLTRCFDDGMTGELVQKEPEALVPVFYNIGNVTF